jgi:hypothetical protein
MPDPLLVKKVSETNQLSQGRQKAFEIRIRILQELAR